MRPRFLTFLMITLLGLAACGSTEPPPEEEPVVDEVAEAVTPAPTVSLPTATPTEVKQTASPTLTKTSPSPTPIPSPTPQIHVVELYDTLLGLAIDYNTTVEALVVANGISEDDFLQIGQELVIVSPADLESRSTPEEPAATLQAESAATNATEAAAVAGTSDEAAPASNSAAAEAAAVEPSTDPAANNNSPAAPSTEPAAPAVPAARAALPTISRPDNVNPLTGLPVDDPAKLRRRPLMVRIGNDAGARQSQVGLNRAEIVYEEITEWWVTRFTAIYLAETLDAIGPVRSARLINVQLVPQYQGALAHSGGSDAVRWEISQAPIANLDEFYNARPYFYRPNEGWQTRLAVNGISARDYMAAKGLDAAVAQQGFLFRDTVEGGEPGQDIYIPYPRATSFTEWHYDTASGKYLRWINGAPLYDVGGGQVAASNVIVYFAEHRPTDIVEDANGATSIRIIVNGKGPAWFFRDGKLNKGFWETDGSRTPYFAYEDGSPYSLKPGNSWVEVVPTYFTIGLNGPDEASASP